MIAVPITASSINEALKDIKKAEKQADVIEIRLDYIKNPDLTKLLSKKSKPIIVTARKSSEGGKLAINEKKRIELLKKAIELSADFVDIELSAGENTIKELTKIKKNTQIIVSHHNFKETPSNLIETYNKIRQLSPDIIKIAAKANKIEDNLKIIDVIIQALSDSQKIIAFCMGEKGALTRIMSPIWGSFLTFGSLEQGKESAPGQLTADALKNIYRVNKLQNSVNIYGLIGNPVDKSKGYIIHNKAFEQLNLNSMYLNFLVDDLASFIKNFRNYFEGLSITMPFKQEIIKHLDYLDPIAKKIKSVNTVIKKQDKLIGYNTDLTGAIKSIESKTKLKGKNALMLGAGGAARAIAFGIVEKGGTLTIINRTAEKAKALAKELKCKAAPLSELKNQKNVDIIINATSIGMHPKIDETPIKKEILKKITSKTAIVFDTIYNPKKTKLLKDSETLNLITISGIDMFINQAAEQFKLFTGKEMPVNVVRELI